VPAHCRMRGFDRDLIRGGHYGQRSCEPRKKAEHMAARPISNPVAFRGEADMNWQARRLNRSRMTRTGSRGPESDNSLRPLDLGSTPQPFAVMC
jgi:hypothetical protein